MVVPCLCPVLTLLLSLYVDVWYHILVSYEYVIGLDLLLCYEYILRRGRAPRSPAECGKNANVAKFASFFPPEVSLYEKRLFL